MAKNDKQTPAPAPGAPRDEAATKEAKDVEEATNTELENPKEETRERPSETVQGADDAPSEGATQAAGAEQDRLDREDALGLTPPGAGASGPEAQGGTPAEAAARGRAATKGATSVGTGVRGAAEPAPAYPPGAGEAPHRHVAEARAARASAAPPAPTRFDGKDTGSVGPSSVGVVSGDRTDQSRVPDEAPKASE